MSDTVEEWLSVQNALKQKLVKEDSYATPIRRVGGVDVSFFSGDSQRACATLVVLSFPELNVIYEDYKVFSLSCEYVSGFLAFREVGALEELIQALSRDQPALLPQVVLVDGNGLLHKNGFGLACHLGVLCDIPTIGVGKKLHCFDGLTRDRVSDFICTASSKGQYAFLKGDSGMTHGAVLKTVSTAKQPVYVSVGHRVSLESAIEITVQCSLFKIPEPVRQADIRSREYIRGSEHKSFE